MGRDSDNDDVMELDDDADEDAAEDELDADCGCRECRAARAAAATTALKASAEKPLKLYFGCDSAPQFKGIEHEHD